MNPVSRAIGLLLFGIFAAIFLLGWISQCAFAQDVPADGDHVHGHARYHDQDYRHWLPPGGAVSCCNAREIGAGGEVRGDCYPTVFVATKDGHWRARLAAEDGAGDGDGWVTVPDSRIIREKNPDPSGTSGHLCYSFGAVLCAVPPAGTL